MAISGAELPNTINVQDFGAKGHGMDSDRDAIRAAVAFALKEGKDLYFPPGRYFLTKLSAKEAA